MVSSTRLYAPNEKGPYVFLFIRGRSSKPYAGYMVVV